MKNNIPTVYISEIHCCIFQSSNLSTILAVLNKKCKQNYKF